MAEHFYLMPMNPTNDGNSKYASLVPVGNSWACMTYGPEPQCIFAVDDIDDTVHAAIAANSDVFSFPADLDAALGTSCAAAQEALEARQLPAGERIVSTQSYRQLLRFVATLCLFMQRFCYYHQGTLFTSSITLASSLGGLDAQTFDQLKTAAMSLGYDVTGVDGNTTLREALTYWADQWPVAVPIYLGPEIF